MTRSGEANFLLIEDSVRPTDPGLSSSRQEKSDTGLELLFPRQDIVTEKERETEDKNREAKYYDGTETLLVVEDEELVLSHVARLLTKRGYRVLTATSGKQALELFKRENFAIALVITDVIMPEMNGRELVDRLQALAPSTNAIFMSGYPKDVLGKRGMIDANLVFVEKPFRSALLLAKIREVLDGAN